MKRTMYVQPTLGKSKREYSPLEVRICADAQVTKKEDVMAESKRGHSLTLTKEGRIAMSSTVRAVVLLCKIYNVNFQNLAGYHEFVGGEDLSGEVDFASADRPQYVQRAQIVDHLENEVFCSKDMKNLGKVLRNVVSREHIGSRFAPLYYLESGRRLLLWNERKSETVAEKNTARVGLSVRVWSGNWRLGWRNLHYTIFVMLRAIIKPRLQSLQHTRLLQRWPIPFGGQECHEG